MANGNPDLDPYVAWESGDFKQAFRLFSIQAMAGDAGAQLSLGYFYDVGLGTRKNRSAAMRWYRRAYRRGSGAAASNIATIYRDAGNMRQVFAWYKRAASLKDGDAMVELAKLYTAGKGIRKNPVEALRVLKRATASKYITAAGREEAQLLLRESQQRG